MILIADAGGTSINWRMISEEGKINQAVTDGFNAYTHPKEKLRKSLEALKENIPKEFVTKVFFYGAGLLSDENKAIVRKELNAILKPDYSEINHDLLAAARSLLGNNPGIACILGTGSNSCFYDGRQIVENKPSLGYILGDEGSGNALGKKLLRLYYRDSLPNDLKLMFESRYRVDLLQLLKEIYTERKGPDYFAGYAKFLYDNIRHPSVYQMVYEEFAVFFDTIIAQYKNAESNIVSFCGGIAYNYANILRQVANDKGFPIRTIVENPIAGLALYHQNNDL